MHTVQNHAPASQELRIAVQGGERDVEHVWHRADRIVEPRVANFCRQPTRMKG